MTNNFESKQQFCMYVVLGDQTTINVESWVVKSRWPIPSLISIIYIIEFVLVLNVQCSRNTSHWTLSNNRSINCSNKDVSILLYVYQVSTLTLVLSPEASYISEGLVNSFTLVVLWASKKWTVDTYFFSVWNFWVKKVINIHFTFTS